MRLGRPPYSATPPRRPHSFVSTALAAIALNPCIPSGANYSAGFRSVVWRMDTGRERFQQNGFEQILVMMADPDGNGLEKGRVFGLLVGHAFSYVCLLRNRPNLACFFPGLGWTYSGRRPSR